MARGRTARTQKAFRLSAAELETLDQIAVEMNLPDRTSAIRAMIRTTAKSLRIRTPADREKSKEE